MHVMGQKSYRNYIEKIGIGDLQIAKRYLENLIFYSKFVIRDFFSMESLVYYWRIFRLIRDFVHSFLSPFEIQGAF